MTNLIIDKTDITPEVFLDSSTNEISITGVCLPENARDFFDPVLKWVENILEEKANTIVGRINLHYFNSSSSKQLLKLFYILEDASEANVEVTIHWCHAEDDYMTLEKGQEFKQMTALNFIFETAE